MTIPLKKVARRWMKERGFKEGYEALEDEFALANEQARVSVEATRQVRSTRSRDGLKPLV